MRPECVCCVCVCVCVLREVGGGSAWAMHLLDTVHIPFFYLFFFTFCVSMYDVHAQQLCLVHPIVSIVTWPHLRFISTLLTP